MPTPTFTMRFDKELKKRISELVEVGLEDSLSAFLHKWGRFGIEHGTTLEDAGKQCNVVNGTDYCKNCGMDYSYLNKV